MNKSSSLLEEIERLRAELEHRSRGVPFNSKELLQLSERLDRLINAYLREGGRSGVRLRSGLGGAAKKNLRLSRQPYKIKNRE